MLKILQVKIQLHLLFIFESHYIQHLLLYHNIKGKIKYHHNQYKLCQFNCLIFLFKRTGLLPRPYTIGDQEYQTQWSQIKQNLSTLKGLSMSKKKSHKISQKSNNNVNCRVISHVSVCTFFLPHKITV